MRMTRRAVMEGRTAQTALSRERTTRLPVLALQQRPPPLLLRRGAARPRGGKGAASFGMQAVEEEKREAKERAEKRREVAEKAKEHKVITLGDLRRDHELQ